MNGTMIAFSGKGGAGKTTTTAMMLRHLIRTGHKPILAVDADPNATLALTLGVEPGGTIADLRDKMGEAAASDSAVPKDRLMNQYLAEVLEEHDGFDLLTMGRPEGPKCYCYVNGLLRRYLSLLRHNYAVVLVDCEAGMEYMSRLVVDDIETLVLVGEPSPIGLTTVRRIYELSESLNLKVGRRVVAVNKVPPTGAGAAAQRLAGLDKLERIIEVPLDADLAGRCARGEPVDAHAGTTARAAIDELTRTALGAPVAATRN